jgi:hypothetical protein
MKPSDFYIDAKTGAYLGQDNAKTNEVRVVEDKSKFDNAKKDATGKVVSPVESKKLVEYEKGVAVQEATWDKIEDNGGERLTPYVTNRTDDVIYYKPEGMPHDDEPNKTNPNPYVDADKAYPIAPGTELYSPVDGVKTAKMPEDKVFKVATGGTIDLFKTGGKRVGGTLKAIGANIVDSKYGVVAAPDPGWFALRDAFKK